jgi:oxygen-independent coproporphyrinogen-3 oxidase
VRIEAFYLPVAENGLADAVIDAAALFALSAAGRLDDNELDKLPPATVFIRNTVSSRPATGVVTEVFFRGEADRLTCRSRRAAAGADEPEAVAAQRLVRLNLLTILGELTGRQPGPWGILRGVRPTKIVHRLLDRGLTPDAVRARLASHYGVAAVKAELITDIALRQRPFLPPAGPSGRLVAVYIGVPYCPSRCLYCSFPANVLPADLARVAAFTGALAADIDAAARLLERHGLAAESVYVGGGTPTSLGEADFAALLAHVRRAFVGDETREFTVEAGRPDSLSDGKIAAMAAAGVSRVSVNPQTMQEKTLKLIGRKHSVYDIIEMFRKIRATAIETINMDIIAGLPGEDEAAMADTLARIGELAPDNLTVHTLAIKRGSLLAERPEAGLPGEVTTANMLALAADAARRLGMQPYYLYRQKYMTGNLENVGYAIPGRECLYNIQIIEERQTVIGVGPAAGTKAVENNFRLTSCYNPKDVSTYIKNLAVYTERRDSLIAGLFRA